MTEEQSLRKEKVCCSCKHFRWFMGSAGYCGKRDNTIRDMIDAMDCCNNGLYRYKRPTSKVVLMVQRVKYCIKRWWNKMLNKNRKDQLEDFEW